LKWRQKQSTKSYFTQGKSQAILSLALLGF